MTRPRTIILSLLLTALTGGAVYAAFQLEKPAPPPLAASVPPGALLAIESPDFAALLKSWNNSPEQKRWLAGADYAGFSRSRLFALLGRAQEEFAEASNSALDGDFLQQVAGNQSIFAWYDINKLEFLYITHLPPGAAAKLTLLTVRDKFQKRIVGDTTFYLDTNQDTSDSNTTDSTGINNTANGDAETADPQKIRTVAFALRGDYLLLATREDLLTSALQLMQQPSADARTLQHESFYAATVAAATHQPGDLRITVNLAKLVPMPFFRSYWAPQNITELKQYSASLSDLYRSSGSFREERVLLTKEAAPNPEAANTDLSPVLDYLPPGIGVYRATAHPAASEVLTQLEDKLLTRGPSPYRDPHIAPVADLATPTTGDTTSLEQRIDEPALVAQPQTAALTQLRDLLTAAPPSAMLTFSTASTSQQAAFSPIHTAVVLASPTAWNATTLQQDLTAALSPRLSIGTAGLLWTEHHNATASWYELTGTANLALAIQGNLCILASDQPTLAQLLAVSQTSTHTPRIATTIAGFDHHAERDSFTHLTALLDRNGSSPKPPDSPYPDTPGTAPPFFSGNMASLSDTFKDLDSETFTQSSTPDQVTHQTVVYQWHH